MGLYPPLLFYSINLYLFPLSEMTETIFLSLLFCGVLWVVFYMMRRQAIEASAATGVLSFLLLSHNHYRSLLAAIGFSEVETYRLLMQLPYLAVCVLFALLAMRLVRHKPGLIDPAIVFCLVLLAFPSTSLGRTMYAVYSARNGVITARSTDTPPTGNKPVSTLPNITVLMLDGYARADVLKKLYRYDNGPFVRALEERGFFVASGSRCNYSGTLASLVSTLNMSYLDSLDALKGEGLQDRMVFSELFSSARIWSIAKGLGYSIASFDAVSMLVKKDSDILIQVDAAMHDFPGYSFSKQTFLVIIQKALGTAGLEKHSPSREDWRSSIINMLRHSVHLSSSIPPMLTFVHILSPHPPFVFARPGHQRVPFSPVPADGSNFHRINGTGVEYFVEAYAQQVEGLNIALLETIDDIRSQSRPQIIILFSDHGAGAHFDYDHKENCNDWERMSNLIAVYYSDGETTSFYNDMTTINLFPIVFNSWLGTSLSMHEDISFRWPFLSPDEMEDISDTLDAMDEAYGGPPPLVREAE